MESGEGGGGRDRQERQAVIVMTTTHSGRFRVYHKNEAQEPEAHRDPAGDWYFEPVTWSSGDVYSEGYPTQDAALKAAAAWEQHQLL
jgi:hypothetical protein